MRKTVFVPLLGIGLEHFLMLICSKRTRDGVKVINAPKETQAAEFSGCGLFFKGGTSPVLLRMFVKGGKQQRVPFLNTSVSVLLQTLASLSLSPAITFVFIEL